MRKVKSKSSAKKLTPLMEQYFNMKSKHPDAIMLFRVGDFYETFGEDAVKAAEVLGIILTKRNNGGVDIELAGFPYHSLDTYLPKIVRAGYRVAICDQLEKPSKEKKIVKRGVTNVVTPGVTISDTILDQKSNNFLASIHFSTKDKHGIAFVDISTGEFLVNESDTKGIEKLIHSFQPSEIIFSKGYSKTYHKVFGEKYYTYPLEEWIYSYDYAREKLTDKFEVQNLKGFGIEAYGLAQIAGGAAIHYLMSTQNERLQHISRISRIQSEHYVWLDRFTVRNLELISSVHQSGIPLIDILDRTVSPMGARMLKKWVYLPLISIEKIQNRHEVVQYFTEEEDLVEEFDNHIKIIGDLERLVSKISMERISPREILQLKNALNAIIPVKDILKTSENEQLSLLAGKLNDCDDVRNTIEEAITENPPALVSKGNVFKKGYNEALDEYRNIATNGKDLLIGIQQEEAKKTGIANLKIGFNNVFGYYLEVTNKYKNQGLVPENWIRKQTLTGSERYITEELKELEAKILGAEEKIQQLEEKLFAELVTGLTAHIEPVQVNAKIIANLDCLLSFAKVAVKNNYCKPTIDDSHIVDIKEGRHPVIEQHLNLDEQYVPNDIYLDNETQQLIMITGPNMSGKSAVLRQTALIVLMAQMGSYVPAASARIGLIDKVFTRVGASDNISSGESTFMLEMNETANIMNNISERSLILLDEIGRGTATYDGISIAWSLAEYLHNNNTANPKTLFATHYHELNELAEKYERIKNYNVATKEVGNKVIFLRKLVSGGSKHSFGIHVARMAGMPREIIKRANTILRQLEQKSINVENKESTDAAATLKDIPQDTSYQLSIFETVDPVVGEMKKKILELDIHNMTPIECMMKLNELKDLLEESGE